MKLVLLVIVITAILGVKFSLKILLLYIKCGRKNAKDTALFTCTLLESTHVSYYFYVHDDFSLLPLMVNK
jgi:hypothetical protein